MSPSAVYLTLGALVDLAGVVVIVWWFSTRKRLSAETLARAEAHGRSLREEAERAAETIRKEAQIEAREKAHVLTADAEERARTRRHEIAALEQALADRTRTLADRIAATDAFECELRTRDTALTDLQKRAEAAATRGEQLLAERHRELQRVAGLTADEA